MCVVTFTDYVSVILHYCHGYEIQHRYEKGICCLILHITSFAFSGNLNYFDSIIEPYKTQSRDISTTSSFHNRNDEACKRYQQCYLASNSTCHCIHHHYHHEDGASNGTNFITAIVLQVMSNCIRLLHGGTFLLSSDVSTLKPFPRMQTKSKLEPKRWRAISCKFWICAERDSVSNIVSMWSKGVRS